jgi:hypothetical protein
MLGLLVAGLAAAPSCADVAAFDGIAVAPLAKALERHTVQQRGQPNPSLSAAGIASLRALISRSDPGRIWIAVVTPVSEHLVGQVANSLGNLIPHDGAVIVVGGYNSYVVDTWTPGNSATAIMSSAFSNQNESLATQLGRAVTGFARLDARLHHPTPLADQIAPPKAATNTQTSTTSSTGTSTQPTVTDTTPASTNPASAPPSKPKKQGSSSSIGLILVLVAVLVLALIGAGAYGRRARAAAKLKKHVHDDTHAKAHDDLTKLGDRIRDMDIDSSMPKADPDGKAAYAQALDCYQDAEKRLKQENDSYEFDHAMKAIADGLAHLDTAERLFDAGGRAKELLPAEVIDRLTKLAKLHRSGALTDDEFAAEKKKILS